MRFNYVRPETGGVSPRTVGRFLDSCEREINSLYSFAIAKGMSVLSEGYYRPMAPDQPKMLRSVSKSLNSLAVGIAIGDGRLGLDDCLADYFRDEMPEKHDPRVERIRIRDALVMAASSAYTSSSFVHLPTSWRAHYLGLTPHDEPGRSFFYDTGAAYMLSCLVTKVMGVNTLALMKERVFGPMGIENVDWLEDRYGNTTGGWGCYMTPADLRKIGRLLLNYGEWEGRQLVPSWYMRQALSKRIDTYRNPCMGWPYGYGYQFWLYPERTFGCFGAFGQLIVCSPEKDLWATVTAGCIEEECQRLLRIIVETIFAESLDEPLPMDDVAYGELSDRIGGLTLPVAPGAAGGADEAAFLGRKYLFGDNPSKIGELAVTREGPGVLRVAMLFDGKPVEVRAGHGEWLVNSAPLDEPLHTLHGFTYGWTGANALELKQYMCNSCFYNDYSIVFSGDEATLAVSLKPKRFDQQQHAEGVIGRADR